MSRDARIRLASVLLAATVGFIGCGNASSTTTAAAPMGRSAHEQDIYDQQRATCHTEQRFNSADFRNHGGANNPEGYAEFAAEHGFYLVRSAGEHQAAIDGCLAGLKP